MSELRLKSTGTIKLFENDNTSSVTIASPASLGADRTITLPDASVTLASGTMLATDGSGASLTGLPDNTPAFFAYRADSTQSATLDTATKVQFNGEIFDTDNTFDSSTNYRFTPAVAGKYHLFSHVRATSDTQQKGINAQMGIYKNGSVFIQSKPFDFYTAGYAGIVSSWGCTIDCILDSDADDYFEVYVTYNTSSGDLTFLNSGTTDIRTWFQGYKLIGA